MHVSFAQQQWRTSTRESRCRSPTQLCHSPEGLWSASQRRHDRMKCCASVLMAWNSLRSDMRFPMMDFRTSLSSPPVKSAAGHDRGRHLPPPERCQATPERVSNSHHASGTATGTNPTGQALESAR